MLLKIRVIYIIAQKFEDCTNFTILSYSAFSFPPLPNHDSRLNLSGPSLSVSVQKNKHIFWKKN